MRADPVEVLLLVRGPHGERNARIALPSDEALRLIAAGRAERIVTVLLGCAYTNHNRGERCGLPESEARELVEAGWAEVVEWPRSGPLPLVDPGPEPPASLKDFPSPRDKMVHRAPRTKEET